MGEYQFVMPKISFQCMNLSLLRPIYNILISNKFNYLMAANSKLLHLDLRQLQAL